MPILLPLYPVGTHMISDYVGMYKKDGIVQYIVNGLPVFCHGEEDYKMFRYITSNFIKQGLCRQVDIQRTFQVSDDSVARYYKKYLEQGELAFFGEDGRKGKAYKIVGKKRESIQKKLDKGQSVNSIAKQENVQESAIRYQIKQGYLKKSKVLK